MVRRRVGSLEKVADLLERRSDLRAPGSASAPPVGARDWEAAVGSRIAARAKPVRLVKGVLHVRAATATWAQELALLSETLLEQLRARGTAVESLRFHVGTVDPPRRPPWRNGVRRAPPEVPLPESLREKLAQVRDPALRQAIALAAARNLGWQEAHRKSDGASARGPSRPLARPAPRLPRAHAEPAQSENTAAPSPPTPPEEPALEAPAPPVRKTRPSKPRDGG